MSNSFKRYESVRDELIELLTKMHTIPKLRNDERSPKRITYLLWLAHRLARVSDHGNAICVKNGLYRRGQDYRGSGTGGIMACASV